MTRKEIHDQRYKEPTAEALKNLPKDVLADMLGECYTDAMCRRAGIAKELIKNRIADAVEQSKQRDEYVCPDTKDLFD